MNELSDMLKNARLSKNLGIQQVSDDTKIRLHILKDIESGNFSSVPDVYMKSFIKTLAAYYKIPLEDINNQTSKTDQKSFDDDKPSKPIEKVEKVEKVENKKTNKPKRLALDDYSAQFKKASVPKLQKVKKVNKASLANYIVYTILFVAITTSIVITVISMLPEDNEGNDTVQNSNNNNDTIRIESKKEDLLTYFQNGDSLSLKAVAKDTAWLRLIIDDKKFVEELLRPGDNKEWFAYEQFILDVGNAAAISFYRNGEQLPMLGKPGTVAKNIKITRDNVISISSLQPKDTNNVVKKPKIRKKKETEVNTPPPIIESTIQEEDNLLKRR